MRCAIGNLVSAGVLFVAAAVGAVGSWALPLGAVGFLSAAVIGVIAMEERDLVFGEHLYRTRRPVSVGGEQRLDVESPTVKVA